MVRSDMHRAGPGYDRGHFALFRVVPAVFFFSSRRRHTRFDCDWSSDVCSSDLTGSVPSVQPFLDRAFATAIPLRAGSGTRIKILEAWAAGVPVVACRIAAEEIGRASCRERV